MKITKEQSDAIGIHAHAIIACISTDDKGENHELDDATALKHITELLKLADCYPSGIDMSACCNFVDRLNRHSSQE